MSASATPLSPPAPTSPITTDGHGISVCLLEDDAALRESLSARLAARGFEVRAFGDARSLYLGLLRAPCHVVVDLYLPGEDGFAVVQELSRYGNMRIMVLTASQDPDDLVRCLTGGADAFLVKPVNDLELAATVISLYRRMNGTPDETKDWRLVGDGWTLVTPQGQCIGLTPSERILMRALFARPNAAVTRDALLAALGYTEDDANHRLDMLFSRLRRKVRETAGQPLPLKAVRGIGFLLSLHFD